jgi:transposase InsO family protein
VVQQCGDRFGVEPICRVLGYRSASTVYARRNRRPSARRVREEQVLAAIGAVRVGHAACYGARRTWLALRRAGVQVARCTVERVMRQAGLLGVQRGRKAPCTTTPDRSAVRPPDLVNRNFTATGPDQLWLSDITSCPHLGGVRLRRVRHGRLLPPDHRLADRRPPSHRPTAGCPRNGPVEPQRPRWTDRPSLGCGQ